MTTTKASNAGDNVLVTLRQLEERRGVPRRTLAYWVAEKGLPHIRMARGRGSTIWVRLRDFDEWISRFATSSGEVDERSMPEA